MTPRLLLAETAMQLPDRVVTAKIHGSMFRAERFQAAKGRRAAPCTAQAARPVIGQHADRGDEPVALLADCFDVAWAGGGVLQRPAQPGNDLVHLVVALDLARPAGIEQRLGGDDLAAMPAQFSQHGHGSRLQRNDIVAARDAVRRQVDRPVAKQEAAGRHQRIAVLQCA